MKLRPLIVAALLAAPVSAIPVSAAYAQAAGATGTSDVNSRRICRVTPRIGSRLGGTRTCRTKTEWDAADREAREAVNRYQRTTASCMMGSNDPRNPHLVCSSDGP